MADDSSTSAKRYFIIILMYALVYNAVCNESIGSIACAAGESTCNLVKIKQSLDCYCCNEIQNYLSLNWKD